ncbi:MAG: hypothetical protein ACLSAH_17025 [Bilophila wadsworthia]
MMIIGTVFAAQLDVARPVQILPLVAISAYESCRALPWTTRSTCSPLTTCLFCLLLFIALGKHLFQPVSKLESLDIKLIIKESDMTLTASEAASLPRRTHHIHDAAQFPPKKTLP